MPSQQVILPHIPPDADGTFDSHYHPRGEVDGLLATKANQSDLGAKADQTALDTTNANVTANATAIAAKADTTYVDAQDATKQDVASLGTAVANTAAVKRVDPGTAGAPGQRIGFDEVGTPLLLKSPYNVRSFGQIGTADDTTTVQHAIDSINPHEQITIEQLLAVSQVTLDRPYVHIHGPGGFSAGKLIIGTAGGGGDLYYRLDGLTFAPATKTAGSVAIELVKGRRGAIANCVFQNVEKAVSVPSSATGFHTVSLADITRNEFTNVDYAVYTAAATWNVCSDWKISRNTVNLANLAAVWIGGMDGLDLDTNTVFMLPYTSGDTTAKNAKLQAVYIGQADWVQVVGNKLFEPGLEGLLLDSQKNFLVIGNLIAYAGEKQPADAVRLTNTAGSAPDGLITNNTFDRFSRHAVAVEGVNVNGLIKVHNNVGTFDSATATYYGGTALTSIPHYTVYQDPASTHVVRQHGNDVVSVSGESVTPSLKNAVRTSYGLSSRQAVSATSATKSVTAASTPVFALTAYNGSTNTYTGLVHMEARQGTTNTANMASYLLHVTKSQTGATVTQVSAQGLTAGSSASWPSFTWGIDASDNLTASPVGSTSGSFNFFATYSGNLLLA